MPWVGFEPTISAGERSKTYALDRAATGTGCLCLFVYQIMHIEVVFLSFLAQQPPVGHGLLIHEVSRSHTTTQHSR